MRPSKAARAAPAVDTAQDPRIERLGGPLGCENSRSLSAHQALEEDGLEAILKIIAGGLVEAA
jgi:hypothetical protein